jgi:cytochrome d ubiquinol oxidase subunit II
MFAAWPYVYAVAFSALYILMMILLLSMSILRPVAFKYRSKMPSTCWRNTWDRLIFMGGVLPAFIFGVLIGNVLQGLPFHFDFTLHMIYTGTFLGLFNPFALICGLISLSMMVMHGGLYLATKTEKGIRDRAIRYARLAAIVLVMIFAGSGIWVSTGLDAYSITTTLAHAGPSNPLIKTGIVHSGRWTFVFSKEAWSLLPPCLGLVGAILAWLLAKTGESKFAFVCSGLSIAGIISTVGAVMFPFILPSSTHPNSSLMVWDASSSQHGLFLMLIVAIIFLPRILGYTAWVYRVMRGKVTEKFLSENNDVAY